ncbi:proline-rich receptor-like protein kinase PERK10 [Lathyrus oleraceus]|uniref:proline-rich receptor-like protein kinase PERK10 n=1 Tax=Pisum sativum TaxID=3888 RepID=UPI0021CFB4FD|nr:proline-rich receptor-like protein kinase PERK10 [Pisum sativum]
MDYLLKRPPNFMKRQRKPSGKSKKAKKEKLGETSRSIPPVPLADSPITFPPFEQQNPPLSDQPLTPPSEQQNPPPSDQPLTPPPEQQTNPPSEQPQTPPPEQPTPSPSEHQPSPPPEQTTPPLYDIPLLPTTEDIIIPTQNPVDTNPTPPSSPSSNPEPETAFPTLEEAITLFAESSLEKIKDAGIRLHVRLVIEVEEKARKEAKEKARLEEEQRIREVEEKAIAEEVTHITIEEAAKANVDALTQGE